MRDHDWIDDKTPGNVPGVFSLVRAELLNVRYWPKADMPTVVEDGRSCTKARIRLFVIAITPRTGWLILSLMLGGAMKRDKDIIALIELLKMAAKRWPHSDREISQRDSFHRDRSLLEMWPEACRRVGVGGRDFPSGVIKLWKEGVGDVN